MDKDDLLDQLRSQIRSTAEGALEAAVVAAEAARAQTDPTERPDASGAVELARMARGQAKRQARALAELSALESFRPRPFQESETVTVGAIVEIEDVETDEGRTFFLAPAGAGTTLLGPGGDGHLTVVTPHSPVGSAVIGQRVGDIIDVTLKGKDFEWRISFVG